MVKLTQVSYIIRLNPIQSTAEIGPLFPINQAKNESLNLHQRSSVILISTLLGFMCVPLSLSAELMTI
jgi:hypothetical protein